MDFAADTPTFYSDFGVDASLGGVYVRGFLDKAPREAFEGMVAGREITFRLPSSYLAQRGQALVVGSESYVVAGIEQINPDENLLILEES